MQYKRRHIDAYIQQYLLALGRYGAGTVAA
jgi:hypothetical protein